MLDLFTALLATLTSLSAKKAHVDSLEASQLIPPQHPVHHNSRAIFFAKS